MYLEQAIHMLVVDMTLFVRNCILRELLHSFQGLTEYASFVKLCIARVQRRRLRVQTFQIPVQKAAFGHSELIDETRYRTGCSIKQG